MKNYWKYIVISLLASLVTFHVLAIWHIRGESYQLTSKDYYARELTYEQTLQALRRGQAYKWDMDLKDGFHLTITDVNGAPLSLEEVDVHLYRPDKAELDQLFQPEWNQEGYKHQIDPLKKGKWSVTIKAQKDGETIAWRTKLVI